MLESENLWGWSGVLAVTGVAAATTLYLLSRPKPAKPRINYDEQSLVLPGPDRVHVSKLLEGAKKGETLSFLYDDVRTLRDSFLRGVKESNNGRCLGWREGPDKPYIWQSYNETLERVNNFGSGLLCLGLAAGQNTFIGIFAKNCPEWVMTELAAYFYSMVIVPLYDTLGTEACVFIVNQTEMTTIVCEDDAKTNLLLDQSLQSLRVLITIKEVSPTTHQKAADRGVEIIMFHEVEKQGAQAKHPCVPPKSDDLSTICYTSGTTGVPKGAMLTHENVVSCLSSAALHYQEHSMRKDDVMISILPLAHVYERFFQHTVYMAGGAVGFYSGDLQRLGEDFAALKPTILVVVPRLLNKVYDKAQAQISKSRIKKLLFNYALSAKQTELKRGIIRNNSIWDKLVFRKIREGLGGRARLVTVGSAPLAENVLTFFRCAAGCPVVEGYGQTEAAGPASCSFVGDDIPGHIGPPIACCQMKLIDVPEMEYYKKENQGELCIKGANVFKGYYKDPEKTKEVLDEDGWLHTGDVAEWLPSGVIKIIDRRKHIFKLAQGEYIVPEKIENIYIRSIFVEQVFVYGESLKSCLVAIVVPAEDAVKSWASDNDIKGSFSSLCENLDVKRTVMENMIQMGQDAGLKTFEQVKDVYLHPESFSIQNGLLTPTMKSKRPEIKNYFNDQLKAMYRNLS